MFYYFKKAGSLVLKIIIAILIGLSLSFGKKLIDPEKRDDETIGSNK